MKRTSLTARGRALLIVGILIAAAGAITGYHDVTRVGTMLTVLVVCTRLLVSIRGGRLVASRDISPAVVSNGTPTSVRLRVHNTGNRRTRYALAEEEFDYALGDPPRFELPGLDLHGGRVVDYEAQTQQRGRHFVGPVHVTAADPFGLARRRVTVGERDSFVVLPRFVDLGSDSLPGAGQGSEGETPQILALHGEQDVSIRGYRDGDDLRRVHWPTSAHRGELMVRQDDRPSRRSCMLVLDPAAGGDDPTGPGFEWAVSALASIAGAMHARGYVLRLATAETVASGRAAGDFLLSEVLVALAEAEPGTPESTRSFLRSAHEHVGNGSVVIAVARPAAPTAAELARLRQAGSSALVALLGARSSEGSTDTAERVLADAGWRTVRVTPDTNLREAWAQLSRRSLVRVGAL